MNLYNWTDSPSCQRSQNGTTENETSDLFLYFQDGQSLIGIGLSCKSLVSLSVSNLDCLGDLANTLYELDFNVDSEPKRYGGKIDLVLFP